MSKKKTEAKYAFVKCVLDRADRIIGKSPKMRPETAISIAFNYEAGIIVSAIERYMAKDGG